MIKKLLNKFLSLFYDELWIDGKKYMQRWRFLPNWLPGFRIHKILISDDGPELHCHPFSFITIILKGGYYEYLSNGAKVYHGPGSILFRPAKTMHRIELIKRPKSWHKLHGHFDATGHWQWNDPQEEPAWTFIIRTRYFRDWGFATPNGWVESSEFISKKRKNESFINNTPTM